ncbi:hypothetical protein K2173_003650 [Erythroxylum novogranatense]|uniref:RING-type E3 ubiquitin transferase n=1 Tax=Erythroxylum novogranatense TaxID=1862640 RepID=A0AAV8TCE5_9ROSI|nr:hypothetical protein K2173_003650 [Erythroxylum novogranatense]
MRTSRLALLTAILFFVFQANAQGRLDSSVTTSNSKTHAGIEGVIGIILVMIFALLFSVSLAKYCSSRNIHPPSFRVLSRSRSRFSGIDPLLISSIPFFEFSSLRGSKEGLECAVCISKFEETEILRLLPKCRHAFHRNCIDRWLENHSSCPLCRLKLDPGDIENFTYSKSLRFLQLQTPSNLSDNPNLELFVQREPDPGPSILKQGKRSRRWNSKGKKYDHLLIDEEEGDDKTLHKLKHKVIVSDVLNKNIWSDLKSSDLLSLRSDMLSATYSNRYSPGKSTSERFSSGRLSMKVTKLEEDDVDFKQKTSSDCNVSTRLSRSNSCPKVPGFVSERSSGVSDPGKRRSMSDITGGSSIR